MSAYWRSLLSEQHRSEFLPRGKEPVFNNRVRWAGFHLNKAQLLSKPRRGYLKITTRGLSVLKRGPAKIDLKLLKEYPEYSAFVGTSGKVSVTSPAAAAKEVNEQPQGSTEVQTSEEAIGSAYKAVRDTLAAELLRQIKDWSPALLER